TSRDVWDASALGREPGRARPGALLGAAGGRNGGRLCAASHPRDLPHRARLPRVDALLPDWTTAGDACDLQPPGDPVAALLADPGPVHPRPDRGPGLGLP